MRTYTYAEKISIKSNSQQNYSTIYWTNADLGECTNQLNIYHGFAKLIKHWQVDMLFRHIYIV